MNVLRLCKRTNLTPLEIDEVDNETVLKWMAVLDIEAQVTKEQLDQAQR